MPPMEQTVLSLNSGSSTLKFALFGISKAGERQLANGLVENGANESRLSLTGSDGQVLASGQSVSADAREQLAAIFSILDRFLFPRPEAAGHRIVHGGPLYASPQKVTPAFLESLKGLIPLAPLHLPAQIELMEAVLRHYPSLPEVACFDTAFHAAMPEIARRLPLPGKFWDEGVRRYGFHGLSYESILDALGSEAGGRLIVAHLGNGASMAAIRNRQPIDTSMGLTPTGGFLMSTRSGDLDPGVILYLMRAGQSIDRLESLVDHESGLLGISGLSGNMKLLLEKRGHDPKADQAVQMFCYAIKKFIGSYAAALGGLDTLVFTGGIGEHADAVRAEICAGMEFLGIHLDPVRNARHDSVISAVSDIGPESRQCVVRVLAADEDRMIARHTWRTIWER